MAGNAQNLQAALQRAVPALTETDNLLNLLANDSHTLQDLTATSNSLVTALANRSGDVQRFIEQSNNIATETATQQTALKSTFHDLPGFLESAATLTHSVVALDDGSADGSMAALAASPLVHALIRTNRTSGRWDCPAAGRCSSSPASRSSWPLSRATCI